MRMFTFKCLMISRPTDKSAHQNDLIPNLKRYLLIQIFRYIYVCQWLWLGSQKPSAEFNCSLPPVQVQCPLLRSYVNSRYLWNVVWGSGVMQQREHLQILQLWALRLQIERMNHYYGIGLITYYLRGEDIFSCSHRKFNFLVGRIDDFWHKKGCREVTVKIGGL